MCCSSVRLARSIVSKSQRREKESEEEEEEGEAEEEDGEEERGQPWASKGSHSPGPGPRAGRRRDHGGRAVSGSAVARRCRRGPSPPTRPGVSPGSFLISTWRGCPEPPGSQLSVRFLATSTASQFPAPRRHGFLRSRRLSSGVRAGLASPQRLPPRPGSAGRKEGLWHPPRVTPGPWRSTCPRSPRSSCRRGARCLPPAVAEAAPRPARGAGQTSWKIPTTRMSQ